MPCGEKSDEYVPAEKPDTTTAAPTSPPCAPCGKKDDTSAPEKTPATSTAKSAQQPQAHVQENGLQQHPHTPIDENVTHQQAQQPHIENYQHQDEPSLASIPRPMMLSGATPIREPGPVKPEHEVPLTDRTMKLGILFNASKL